MKQLIIYIAGPYRAATPEGVAENVSRAAAVGQELLRRGHVVICPHSMTYNWDIGTGLADEVFLSTDLVLLGLCDAICMVDGWEKSAGAQQELLEARANQQTVFLSVDEVRAVTP